MNNLIRFKFKMLIVLMFCVFMTFSMLIYVMNLSEKCENPADEMCFQASKTPIVKSNYFYYNVHYTPVTSQLLKPAIASPAYWNPTTEKGFTKVKRTTREVLKSSSVSQSTRNSSEQVPLYLSSQNVSYKTNSSTSSFSPTSSVINPVPLVFKQGNSLVRKFISKYSDRQKTLQHFCHKYFDPDQLLKTKKLQLNHILIDEQHKLLYCYVPKVACTNWKRIFLILTGKASNISQVINIPSSKIHTKNLFPSLKDYSIPEVQKISENYTKFIFVRHPFERLLSAYRNKLEQHYDSSKYFQARFGKFIIKKFRKNPSNVSLEKGDDVTFAEFANYLTSSDPKLYNEHWQRVTDLCHPCLINYDFIGKYENLIEDSNYLLKHLGVNVTFPLLPKPSTTALNLKRYFNTLNEKVILKLYSIYEMDFRLFGYTLQNISDLFSF